VNKGYRVGIAGYGVVGRGIHRLLKDDIECIFDPFVSDDTIYEIHSIYDIHGTDPRIKRRQEDFKGMDVSIVSVMTKANDDGTCDTSIVEETVKWLSTINPKGVILIKNAIVPSKVRELVRTYPKAKIVVSPEYMGESKYFTPFWKYPDPQNMESHTWQIFGSDNKEWSSLCIDIFKRRMSVDTIQLQTTLMTAALTKYMENNFFAMKVTFCNEWYDIAQRYGVDYNELRECWLADTRINRNHTLVFPKDRGYGGKCFPKDVKGIIKDVEKLGYSADLMKSVDNVNERIRNG